jgi:transposase
LERFVSPERHRAADAAINNLKPMSKNHPLPILDPLAAFVDVGSEQMFVSIAGGPPEVFGTFTVELERLRDWLKDRQVQSVAMEATGVYWLPLYGVLEQAGFQVSMVNGRQTRNLPGRKTDMKDCQWGATLHMHGLLQAGFVPPTAIRRLQDYMRLRSDHLICAASCVQLLQKALERMNIKLHDVISNLVGVSGLKVIEAILAGERDPEKLLALCDGQIRKRKGGQVRESLRGTWAEEHLFALRQALENWQHYQRQIAACDRQIEAVLAALADPAGASQTPQAQPATPAASSTVQPVVEPAVQPTVPAKAAPAAAQPAPAADPQRYKVSTVKRPGINAPQIDDFHALVVRLCGGKDLSVLPGHTDYSIVLIISEVGNDLSRWPTEKHFTSQLGLAPGSHQSGKRRGKVGCKRTRAGGVFCLMARALARSKDCALGGFYRRMQGRRGGLVATMALARKLAELFWRVMVKGLAYVEAGLKVYEAKVRETQNRALDRLAKKLGRTVLPPTDPAPLAHA